MSPLGAITALSDIRNLDRRNKIISEKIKMIYEYLENFKFICSVRMIINVVDFIMEYLFCDSEILLNKIKDHFKIIEYNWPILEC